MSRRSASISSVSAPALAVFGLALVDVGFVDQVDALLFEEQQELIELFGIDGVVGEIFVDLAVGQIALFLARIDERLQALIQFQFHQILRRSSGSRGSSRQVLSDAP